MPSTPSITQDFTISHSIEEHAEIVGKNLFEIRQLSKGLFLGKTSKISLGNTLIFHRNTSTRYIIRGHTFDALYLVLPLVDIPLYMNGSSSNKGDVFIGVGTHELMAIFPQNFDHLLVKIPTTEISEHLNPVHAEELIGRFEQYNQSFIETDGKLTEAMLNVFLNISRQLQVIGKDTINPDFYVHLILTLLYEFIRQPEHTRRRQSNYDRIISKCLALTRESSGGLSINDLVLNAHASERTLHNAFNHILGVTPHQLIKAEFFNKVRESLPSAKNKPDQVNNMLKNCGITNLSRFKQEFQEHFGEEI